jgi:hypothetical protein
MRILFAVLRVAVAIAIIAAIVGQLQTSLTYWAGIGGVDVGTHLAHFFSFFTIESNVLSAVVLLIGAWFLVTRKGADPSWYNTLRAATVTYMAVTGIVYNLLLRGVELPQGATLAWSNEVLHVIACAWLVIDWILAPGRSPIGANQLWKILVFPIAWVVYTLIRGPIVADTVYGNSYWYPYPFLNPNTSAEGYFTVAFYVLLIAVAIGSTAAGVLWISRRKAVLAAE